MTKAPVLAAVWSGAATLAAPALRGLLRWRAARGKEIAARLPERRGIDPAPRPEGPLLWLHAASVGETMSILPVLAALARQAPEARMLLTTGTVTSAGLVAQRLPEMGLAERVTHRFVPLDVPVWTARFLDHWQPGVAGFVESELWPNILAGCRARAIPALLINARMSARSFASWSRAPGMAQDILAGFAGIHARGEEDAARLRALGAPEIAVVGDLKRAAPALSVDQAVLRDMAARLSGRPVWLAASTHPGEEALIRTVHDQLRLRHPGLLTIIVPRHPERGPDLAAALGAPLRGQGQPPPAEGIWIADTLGELGLWYRLSPVVFVGRSLVPPGGGQNLLEPARLGCAIATGPWTGNFTEHVDLLRAADGLTVTGDTEVLTRFVAAMLADPKARKQMGGRAKAAAAAPETLPDDIALMLLGFMRRD